MCHGYVQPNRADAIVDAEWHHWNAEVIMTPTSFSASLCRSYATLAGGVQAHDRNGLQLATSRIPNPSLMVTWLWLLCPPYNISKELTSLLSESSTVYYSLCKEMGRMLWSLHTELCYKLKYRGHGIGSASGWCHPPITWLMPLLRISCACNILRLQFKSRSLWQKSNGSVVLVAATISFV